MLGEVASQVFTLGQRDNQLAEVVETADKLAEKLDEHDRREREASAALRHELDGLDNRISVLEQHTPHKPR
jgi:hypothetical protein